MYLLSVGFASLADLGSTTDPKLSSVAVYSINFKLATILKVENTTLAATSVVVSLCRRTWLSR